MSFTTDLSAYYSLEEATAATRVDSWAGYNLTDHASVAQIAGKNNFGAGFTAASSQYLSHTSAPEVFSLNFYKGGFTVAFWVYVAAITAPLVCVAGEWSIGFNGGGFVEFTVYGDVFGASGIATSGTAVALNAWNLVVCEFKYNIVGSATFLTMTNTMNSQVNNGAIGTGTMTANSSTAVTSSDFNVGRDTFTYGGAFFSGRIDELGIWQRILTPAEKSLLYAGTFYPFAPQIQFPRVWSFAG